MGQAIERGDTISSLLSDEGVALNEPFVCEPVALAMNREITPQARALYLCLRQLAFLNGRVEEDDVAKLPAQGEIAETFGCTRKSIALYLAELTASGWIVRQGRYGYMIRGSLQGVEITPSVVAADNQTGSILRPPRASAILTRSKDRTLATLGCVDAESAKPPKLALIDSRNIAFDALVEVTGADVDAESGRIAAGLKKIRSLYWRDLPDNVKAVMDSVSFERGLATEIRERAALYEIRYRGGVELTPTALAANWVRVTRQQPQRVTELEQWARGKEGS